MKHLFSNTKRSRLRSALILLIGCITALSALPAYGQDVTISPTSGHLIAALTYENEVGFEKGWSALWRHNQLPLSLHVSDKPDLTSSGVLKDPAGNIRLDTDRNLYVLMGGAPVTTHMSFSLPKGFRFTGYRMVLLNDMNGKKNYGGFDLKAINKRMYETNSSFSLNSPLASTAVMSGTNDSKEYVIERTSKTETDMGNNLYFYFWRESDNFYACTIKSIELYFTAENEFQAEGVPGAPDEIISNGVNMVGSEFTTGKLDLGVVKPNTKSGVTYYSYDYQNVIDLTAKNWLYQKEAVTDGKLPETAGSGNIQVLSNDDKLYYALGNGTYYIETPTETKNQNGKTIPLGYRITGAKINAHYGMQANESTITYNGNMGTISAIWKRTTYYLQTNGNWDTSTQTRWTLTKTGKLQSGNNYLSVQKSGTEYIAYGTTNIDEANSFTLSGGHVMYGDLTLSITGNERARFMEKDGWNNNFAAWNVINSSTYNPAFTPSDFQLSLYGTNGETAVSTVSASSSNKNATAEVDGLNNDAVKFTISGLKEGTKALITYNLTMEQLNPFINTLDIVCHSKKMKDQTITQQFTSNDFQVAGGAFHFYVPTAFADANNNCTFTFENLTSKYMDPTYGHGTNGNGRNYFVKSAYYNTYGDGKQYNAKGNEEASTKVSTSWCADQPFKYNNAHELANDNVSATAATLEEYPYSEARYTAADGSGTITGEKGTFTDNIELAVNSPAKDCYLTTGDETRYNIAPTTAMEHRYYAFYLMKIDLDVQEYDAYCRMEKLYDPTCYEGNQEKAMWGGTFEAYTKGHAGDKQYQIPSDQAFLSVSMMVDALRAAEKRDNFTADQVLYLDYTNLYSVLVESKESMAAMKKKLNPNCLIFFPQRTVYNEDNYVSKTQNGDYRACKNIVITDKQPFYSPYKITVPAENYASYSRKITNPMNGKATLATLVLPFSIELSNGVHSNNNSTFTLSQMVAKNCLDINNETGNVGTDFYGKAYFRKVDAPRTTPNTPYMVKVETPSSGDDTSFEILQYGSDIDATPDGMNEDYTFVGETATGTIGGNSHYTFTNYGSYSGKKLAKKTGWFYFAQNKFYNSKNLSEKYDYVYAYPFRAYFGYNKTGEAKDMDGFEVSFDEPTSIGFTPTVSDNGLNIKGGHGRLTLYASSETPVSIASATGVLVWRATVEPNQPQTVTLPSGLYIVNGKKVIIR
ncbi:MAG: hypothetical protein ACOCOB_02180 [Prevotella sp.]